MHGERELVGGRGINQKSLMKGIIKIRIPSVSGGSQGSTEYGVVSISAQSPKIAEWSFLKDSA